MKIAALDIGGTSIKTGIWEDGILKDIKEYDTNAKAGGRAVIEKAITILREYEGFDRIGISTAGQVNSKEGSIRYANENIPGYTGMRVKSILEEAFHVPVAVENDVNAAAIGEAAYGAGKEFEDFLCLTYGTGVGGAIVINKKIYTGSEFSAGEFGGILIHPEARKEGDYFSGCYERYASTTALVERARSYDSSLTNGRKIFERLDEAPIKEIVDEWVKEIMYGLISLIHTFNPSCIVLGGGVMGQTYVVEKLEQMLYTNIMPSFRKVVLRKAELGNTAGLLGAVSLASEMK
nr:ROK family protein [uncultured Niameybacter sp.]